MREAEHAPKCSPDVITRCLENEKYPSSFVWEHKHAGTKKLDHDALGKYYPPIKANRNVSKTCSSEPYSAVSESAFSDEKIR